MENTISVQMYPFGGNIISVQMHLLLGKVAQQGCRSTIHDLTGGEHGNCAVLGPRPGYIYSLVSNLHQVINVHLEGGRQACRSGLLCSLKVV